MAYWISCQKCLSFSCQLQRHNESSVYTHTSCSIDVYIHWCHRPQFLIIHQLVARDRKAIKEATVFSFYEFFSPPTQLTADQTKQANAIHLPPRQSCRHAVTTEEGCVRCYTVLGPSRECVTWAPCETAICILEMCFTQYYRVIHVKCTNLIQFLQNPTNCYAAKIQLCSQCFQSPQTPAAAPLAK